MDLESTNTATSSAVAPELVNSVAEECNALFDKGMAMLGELVDIDTFSEDIFGLDETVSTMQPLWEDLGFVCRTERTAAGLPVLVSDRVVGRDLPTILILGHLDTVFRPGTVAERPFTVADGRAVGPGVADMKGGVVVSWLAVAGAIQASRGLGNVNLRILNNTDEEGGSVGSRSLIEAQVPDVDTVMVFEPARPDGSVVNRRRGVQRFRINVAGRAAHTGVEPWAGASAIEELAHKVIALQDLNDANGLISVTVALISGGSRINIVPEHAWADVDVRVPDMESLAGVHKAIERINAEQVVPGTSASYETFADRPPMVPHAAVPRMIDVLLVAASHLDIDLSVTATGGGSDGCFTSAMGVPTLDGLGPVGGGYHTADEFVRVETIRQRAAISGAFLSHFHRGLLEF